MSSQRQLVQQIKSVLQQLGVTYRDCDGTIVGDCSVCGSGGGGPTTNTISFNPATNQITSTVNGVATVASVILDGGDVTTTSAIVINGNSYPSGTSIQNIVTLLAGLAHPAATFAQSAAPFNWNVATQVGNIPLNATLTDNGAGSYTFNPGNGGASVTFNTAVAAAVPQTNNFVGLTAGNTVTLTHTPLANYHTQVFRGGLRLTTLEYTISGTLITFTDPFGTSGGTGVETVTVDYFRI